MSGNDFRHMSFSYSKRYLKRGKDGGSTNQSHRPHLFVEAKLVQVSDLTLHASSCERSYRLAVHPCVGMLSPWLAFKSIGRILRHSLTSTCLQIGFFIAMRGVVIYILVITCLHLEMYLADSFVQVFICPIFQRSKMRFSTPQKNW